MIYLENTTSAQTVSIPRNDNGGTPSVNPRSYQEGYNAGFEAGEDVGYGDGVAYQKSLLSSTAITENGEYQSENGFSAVSVNVPQTGSSLPLTAITITANTAITETEKAYTGITVNVDTASTYNSGYTDGYTSGETDGYNTGYASGYTSGETNGYASGYTSGNTDGYDSGYTSGYSSGYTSGYSSGYSSGYTSGETDGYNSGYTSGHTDGVDEEKAKMSAVTFTANTAVTLSDGGYSAVTVNVPQTYNIEQNKPFTATSNGNYTVTPSSGSVVVNDRFDSDLNRYYLTATTSGYPSTGDFELLRIEDEFDSSKGYIDIYIYNGVLNYDNMWNPESDVDIDRYGNEIELEIRNANRYVDWAYLSGTYFTYDAMSAVSLTVNVPQSGFIVNETLEPLFTIQATTGDTLEMYMDIKTIYSEYNCNPFASRNQNLFGISYRNDEINIYGDFCDNTFKTLDTYIFQKATPLDGRRIIIQISISPNLNNHVETRIYDFLDGVGSYKAISATSISDINMNTTFIKNCKFNEFKIIKNGVLMNDLKYNGNGKIVDVITGIEYGTNIVPYNPYSSN